MDSAPTGDLSTSHLRLPPWPAIFGGGRVKLILVGASGASFMVSRGRVARGGLDEKEEEGWGAKDTAFSISSSWSASSAQAMREKHQKMKSNTRGVAGDRNRGRRHGRPASFRRNCTRDRWFQNNWQDTWVHAVRMIRVTPITQWSTLLSLNYLFALTADLAVWFAGHLLILGADHYYFFLLNGLAVWKSDDFF